MKENKDKVKDQKTPKVNPATGEQVTLFHRVQNYIEENRNLVLGISIGLIVVTALFFFIKGRIEKSAEEDQNAASFALSKITGLFLANDYEKALKGDPSVMVNNKPAMGLIEIVSKYGSTKQAKIAALYAGICYNGLNNYQDGMKYFKKAQDAESPVILEGANAGLGVCSEALGKLEDAAKYYEKAVVVSKVPGTRNRYQYFEGLCYEKLGKKDLAEKIYREIIAENSSEFAGMSKAGLIRLGTIIE